MALGGVLGKFWISPAPPGVDSAGLDVTLAVQGRRGSVVPPHSCAPARAVQSQNQLQEHWWP